MPAKSRKQFKFFKAMEANPEAAKEKGISSKVIHDYTDSMSKEKWKKLKEKLGKK